MESRGRRLRHELKFFINYPQYRILQKRLSTILKPDPFSDGNNEYHIRSLYFDDMYNSGLHEKLSGVMERNKYRIRIYNLDDQIIKLERKSKRGQYTEKRSSRISRDDYDRIMEGSVDFMMEREDPFLREVCLEFKHKMLKPVVIVDYVREAYIHPMGNVRITFDKELRTGLSSTDLFNKELFTVRALDEPVLIMEVKYDNFLPGFIQVLLQENILQRMAISKYTICRKFNKTNSWEDN